MIPPRGFKSELYPLRHRLIYSCAVSPKGDDFNTVYLPVVQGSTDIVNIPTTIQVNPHNSAYEEDTGPLVHQMSILDKIRISLKFNLSEDCNDRAHTSGLAGAEVFTGDGVQSLNFLWRPIFGSFTEKLDATDDDTTLSVAAILALTHDSTFEDVVPLTTNKLAVSGDADLSLPISTVHDTQAITDVNYSTNLTMEDHVWDEDQFQKALRRFTNKGALRSMVGRTRHVTLSRHRPFKHFYLNKFLPRSVRRIMPFSFLGIQVHCPFITDVEQSYQGVSLLGASHLGIKMIVNYHEWHPDFDQELGTPA